MKIFLSVIAHKYKWKYKTSQYHLWGTPWFLMWSSHCKVVTFSFHLVFQENIKQPTERNDCILKWLFAQGLIFVCTKGRHGYVQWVVSRVLSFLFGMTHKLTLFSDLWKMLKWSRCNHYQYWEALKDGKLASEGTPWQTFFVNLFCI